MAWTRKGDHLIPIQRLAIQYIFQGPEQANLRHAVDRDDVAIGPKLAPIPQHVSPLLGVQHSSELWTTPP